MLTADERLERANQFIEVISNHGRKFFRYKDRVAHLEVDKRGRVWFHDDYTQKRIYTHYNGRWRGFTHGGTLQNLIVHLREYVKTGRKLSRGLFWWPSWYCGGDLWGYGESMEPVTTAASELEIVRSESER